MPELVVVEKEMGISYRDFFRIIGNALGSDDYVTWSTGVRLVQDDRKLEIQLGPEGQRKIALMVIPRTMVTLAFTNYSDSDVKSAVKRFDMMFKKGGG